MFLEDGSWEEANSYCEKVLDQDPENAEALRRMRQRLLKEMTALKDDSSFSERLKEQIQAKLDGAGEYAFIEATRVTFDYM